jgi:hypothetical protein
MVEKQINQFDHALVHAVVLFGESLLAARRNSLESLNLRRNLGKNEA